MRSRTDEMNIVKATRIYIIILSAIKAKSMLILAKAI